MGDIENMLKQLASQTMFHLSDDEMPLLIEEYHSFMKQVKILETIETTNIEPLSFPYEIETTFLREDDDIYIVKRDDALRNVKDIQDNQVKVPKVVG